MVILSWEARFPWTNGTSCWPSPVMGDFGCVLGGQATKSTVCVKPKDIFCVNFGQEGHLSTVCVKPKDIFCVNFGQEGHLPTQHPGFGSKLSSKGKPGTCALLETLQSPVNFFRRAKLLGLLYKFCILPILGETRDGQLSKECRKTFL